MNKIILFSCQKKQEPVNVEKPEDREKIYPVAQEVDNKILTAREQFKEGKVDEGVVLILESLLLFGPPPK